MSQKTIEHLIESLYDFVKSESEFTRSEFKALRRETTEGFARVDHRFDKLEGIVSGHEGRISALEDSMRVVKTKLGFN